VAWAEAWLLEIPEIPHPPPEYARFFYRRLFWRELGRHYDEMTVAEVEEAKTFMALEQRHSHRFQPKKGNV
jgi:hypothetical protein